MPRLPTTSRAQLVDGQANPSVLVTATLIHDVAPAEIEKTEQTWKQYRQGEHAGSDWDWTKMVGPEHCVVGIECRSEMQGLVAILKQPRSSRIEPLENALLYVAFLESAPWNVRSASTTARFLGVGKVLVAAAVKLSIEAGCRGAIGLHALDQACAFYEKCEMRRIGPDKDYYDLVYFEYTGEMALDWLVKVGLTS